MGRLTLNVLLSFAQFEREVTGERIRDKIAASKKKGMWMGGVAPIGYRVQDKQLHIDEEQAKRVREIYRLYRKLGHVSKLKDELDGRGWRTPQRQTKRLDASGGKPFTRGHLYRILSSPIYVGKVPHNGQAHEGKHEAIVDQDLWDEVQQQLNDNLQGYRLRPNAKDASLLVGLVFDAQGRPATTNHASKGGKRYRYYVINTEDETTRIPATELEQAVLGELQAFLGNERRVVAALGQQTVQATSRALAGAKVLASALTLDPVQVRGLVAPVVERVQIQEQSIELTIDLTSLLSEGSVAVSHVTRVPFARQRIGMAVRLVVPGAAPRPRAADQRMVALMLKAYGFLNRLLADEEPSVDAIARSEGLTGSHVVRVLQLGFLAPDVVEAIVCGQQPAALGADRLLAAVPLPRPWASQRQALLRGRG